jgi:hypothetical protein
VLVNEQKIMVSAPPDLGSATTQLWVGNVITGRSSYPRSASRGFPDQTDPKIPQADQWLSGYR